jgi:hypothetical protein
MVVPSLGRAEPALDPPLAVRGALGFATGILDERSLGRKGGQAGAARGSALTARWPAS